MENACFNCSKAVAQDTPRLHCSPLDRNCQTPQNDLEPSSRKAEVPSFQDLLKDISHKNKNQKEIIVEPLKIYNEYTELCSCGEGKDNSHCSVHHFSVWNKFLPRNATYWPKLKLSILICLGSIPWIFLIIYLIFYML